MAAVFIIIIVFWGSIEIRQLTDKEEHTEAEDMIGIEGINPQTAYAGESESQENMGLNGKDANMDDDLTIEKICNFLQDKKKRTMEAGRLQESLINAVNLQVTLCIDKIG